MQIAILIPLLLLSAFQADFTSPKSPKPEYGHGLNAQQALQGWISLFDGQTTYGWEDATVQDGVLVGGRTRTKWREFELRAEVVRPGKITLGSDVLDAPEGPLTKTVRANEPLPIQLGEGTGVRSLIIKPLGMEPAFNGQDLVGWKILKHPKRPPDQQTRWSIEDGVIRAVGGPGALELDRQYGDMVLQVEARTMAPLVNGGVFIRSIPGAFMQGYEAQIFHACYENDPAKPARYSTGAIDDRQLARRLVSRDTVPFTMTVLAVGPHLATWVNGHQTTDWVDNRDPRDNPREGLRLAPGTIQLQAHDPETKLEFRKVQVMAID